MLHWESKKLVLYPSEGSSFEAEIVSCEQAKFKG